MGLMQHTAAFFYKPINDLQHGNSPELFCITSLLSGRNTSKCNSDIYVPSPGEGILNSSSVLFRRHPDLRESPLPEGPEIRPAADKLAAAIAGQRVTRVFFAFDRLQPYSRRLQGETVCQVTARGKAMLNCGDTRMFPTSARTCWIPVSMRDNWQ